MATGFQSPSESSGRTGLESIFSALIREICKELLGLAPSIIATCTCSSGGDRWTENPSCHLMKPAVRNSFGHPLRVKYNVAKMECGTLIGEVSLWTVALK